MHCITLLKCQDGTDVVVVLQIFIMVLGYSSPSFTTVLYTCSIYFVTDRINAKLLI